MPGGLETASPAAPSRESLLAALNEVIDPEMPVSLVELGLIYGIRVDGSKVTVDLTFTAMGCPAAEFILADVQERLLTEPGVEEVKVNIVWDPPWTAARITPEGRETLRLWGLGI